MSIVYFIPIHTPCTTSHSSRSTIGLFSLIPSYTNTYMRNILNISGYSLFGGVLGYYSSISSYALSALCFIALVFWATALIANLKKSR